MKTASQIAGEIFFKLSDERIGGPYLRYDNEKSNKAIGMPPEEQQSPAFSRPEPPMQSGYSMNDVSLPRYQFEISEQPTMAQTKMLPSAKESVASIHDDVPIGVPESVLLGVLPGALGASQLGMGMQSAFLKEIEQRCAQGLPFLAAAKDVVMNSPAKTHLKILGKGLLRGGLGTGAGFLLGKTLQGIQKKRWETYKGKSHKTAQDEMNGFTPQVAPPASGSFVPPLVGGLMGAPLGWYAGNEYGMSKLPGYHVLDKVFNAITSRRDLLNNEPILQNAADIAGGSLWAKKEMLKMMGPVGAYRLGGAALGLGGGLLAGALINKAMA